jgi:CheY-like chemotaxis protein
VKTRILVTDDNEDMVLSMKLLLERAGYEVMTAGDGNAAFEVQRCSPCDILITDIFMPEADGLETIDRFKREFPTVKILAMSAGGGRMKNLRYLTMASVAGADATLAKPFDPAVLLETLGGLLAGNLAK